MSDKMWGARPWTEYTKSGGCYALIAIAGIVVCPCVYVIVNVIFGAADNLANLVLEWILEDKSV